MAKQIGLLQIVGTVHGICFYKMDGKYYARKKSSLSAERVKHDPAFAETMRYAERLGIASKIASVVYKQLVPVGERSREKYREVVGMVMRELAKGGSISLKEEGSRGDTKTGRYTKVADKLQRHPAMKWMPKSFVDRAGRLNLCFTAGIADWCSCCTFCNNNSRLVSAGEKSSSYRAAIYASSRIFNSRFSSSV
ncbi:hypothetical protein [Lacibacter sp.]|uniref:hypothetical protein n=1 Tax=Lacibacter sp. TaxID=1915409 RepID=UPI002B4AFF6F|nr:hypothetical protein [Lacibacter sp.]HLP38657.1 hypothetical protein [Lacibacter sp.]